MGTTAVGCGATFCSIGGWDAWLFVCNYTPAGNINSPQYFQANVMPLATAG